MKYRRSCQQMRVVLLGIRVLDIVTSTWFGERGEMSSGKRCEECLYFINDCSVRCKSLPTLRLECKKKIKRGFQNDRMIT